jgi:hypothetical protein
MSENDPSQHDAIPAGDSALANAHARHGSSTHQSGWQEAAPVAHHRVAPPFGTQHAARPAPEGSIPRTSLAERLRQRVAEHEKG